ncbi:MAG: AMP-binding protein [Nodosilinea sp. LVE1205-7]
MPQSINSPQTFVDLLHGRTEQSPHRLIYRFLPEGEPFCEQTCTYLDLHQQAQAIAVLLQDLGCQQQPVLLLYAPGLSYIAAFFGCLYAGAIAVPAYPPRPNRSLQRIEAIVTDTGVRVALTDGASFPKPQNQLTQSLQLKSLYCLNTDGIQTSLAENWRPPALKAETLAILQYTSGSTAAPKGVMISHGNLLHNSDLISRCFGNTARSRGVSWLPPYHDMGLVGGILQPLYVGAEMTLMSPVSFLQRPVRWLEAIAHYRATTSGGPNFAYDLCVQKTTPEQRQAIDLSSWDLAFTGAEPIHQDTLTAFASAFAPSGFRLQSFYPCYGMAETTLMVTGTAPGQKPSHLVVECSGLEQNQVVVVNPDGLGEDQSSADPGLTTIAPRYVKVVSCGQPALVDQVVIVDPKTHQRCLPDRVGEIWVGPSPSIAQGYWQRQSATQESFQAVLGDSQVGPFLRTGDLGFLYQGNLYVTGRLKDLIIIRGRNYYPQDIEATVAQAHPALRQGACAAFALTQEHQEQLVILQELERSALRRLDAAAVFTAIRRQVAEQYDVQIGAIALLRPNAIAKTSSGKIQRHQCKADFLAGVLDWVHYWPTRDTESTGVTLESNSEPLEAIVAATQLPSISEPVNSNLSVATGPRLAGEAVTANQIGPSRQVLMEWMVDWLAQALKLPTTAIDVQRPLAEYGLDSLNAVELAAALQSSLGVPLSPTLAYEYPTIEALSTYLMATQEQATGSLLESLAEFPRDDQVEQLVDQLAQLSGAEIQALLGTPSIQWN